MKPKLNDAKAFGVLKRVGLRLKVNFDMHSRTRFAFLSPSFLRALCTIGVLLIVDSADDAGCVISLSNEDFCFLYDIDVCDL